MAFVLQGGGSLAAGQIGMLRALLEAQIKPDVIIGSSSGAQRCRFRSRSVVADAAGAASAIADDHYTVAAVMPEHDCCGQNRTVLVELLEDHLRTNDQRWTAIATDELEQQMSRPDRGHTAADAVRGIDWCHLVPVE